MDNKTVKQKLNEYSQILHELNEAGIIRTYNAPTGDYAEWIVSQRYDLELETNSNAYYDAIGQDGKRYQIKSRWEHPNNNGIRLSPIHDYDKSTTLFDFLIVVMFNMDYSIKAVYRVRYEDINDLGKFNKHQNGFIIQVTKKFINDPRVVDITEDFSD